jgi:glycerol-3-phosphate acyltransferase PlsY
VPDAPAVILPLLIAIVIGYLLGSLPFGYWVARSKGVNIFEVGSKNPGATNVRRVLGAGPGNLVFVLDALKGALAASWALLRFTGAREQNWEFISGRGLEGVAWTELGVVGIVAALVGHSFSCFTHFKGGKGVATSVGGLLVLMPAAVLIAAVAWVAVFYTSRYVSLASLMAAFVLVAAAVFFALPHLLISLSLIVALFVIVRHLANIKRLWHGTEHKFGGKTPSPKS